LDAVELERMVSNDSSASFHRFVDILPVELKKELTYAIEVLDRDRKRKLLFAKLLESVLIHIFSHEVSHIYRGHLDYFINSGLVERLQSSDVRDAKDCTDYWAIEHMADMSASWISSSLMMLGAASAPPFAAKLVMLQLLRLWSFAISVCYLIGDQIREEESLHPPAIDRADAAIRTIKVTMAERLNIPQERLSYSLRQGIRDALDAWDLAGWSRRAASRSYYDNDELSNSIRRIESVLAPPPDMWSGGLERLQLPPTLRP
jgi:hypothetical protein